MATLNSKNRSKKSQKRRTPSVSATSCPVGMSLSQWQRALRRQAAERDTFGIMRLRDTESDFVVSSSKSDRSYRVHYYGQDSPYNRCECMDFRTSRLGTCKHIEAISLAKNGKFAAGRNRRPRHTFVFVDYPAGRKIRIHRGEDMSPEMDALISTLFDESGDIINAHVDPSAFIRQAKKLDEAFEWEADALSILIEERDNDRRKKIIEQKYRHSLFDGLLRTSLHPYQADGVRFAFEGGRTINADEMGLGKTVQAIATAELLRREGLITSVLIICPTSLKYQWLSEIKRFTRSSALVVEGILPKRKEQLDDFNYFYKICTFHSISNSIKAGHIPQADMIIYDELQRLKNKETQMGKQLRKLRTQYVMALSGTPLENKIDELYSVTQLVNQYVLGPYYLFNHDTTLTDECGKVVGYQNLHEVADKLSHTLIRRKKSDVKLQMPARTDTNLFVPMTKEQKDIHDENQYLVSILVNKWRRYKFLSEADRKRLLLLLSMMRMVCDSTYILDQKTRFDTKIDETMAIIDTLLEADEGKVVIFSQWERMLRIFAQELEKHGVDFCFLHGGVPSPKRKNLIDRFREDPSCRIFLSTDAGATGLNLQSASLLINLDLPWNPAVLEQRIARIYRLGQDNPVQIINMIARGTIEERMLDTLRFKSDLAAGILDGGEDAVFFDNNKFDRIAQMVEDVITPDNQPAQPETVPRTEPEPTELHRPNHQPELNIDRPTEPAEPSPTVATKTPSTAPDSPEEIRQTVAGGLQALGKIADMLRSPETTTALVDALVKEDPATGQTTLNIPVPDKSTVINLLSAFSTLLNR